MFTSDEITKNFWAKQFPVLILKFAAQASDSDKTEDGSKRVDSYTNEYQENIDLLMKK